MPLKLVPPSETLAKPWKQHSGNSTSLLSFIMFFESIYQDSNDLTCNVGALLLQLRSESTLYILYVLDILLQLLTQLTKVLQSIQYNLIKALDFIQVTIKMICEINLEEAIQFTSAIVQTCKDKSIYIEKCEDYSALRRTLQTYIENIVGNMNLRFNDQFKIL